MKTEYTSYRNEAAGERKFVSSILKACILCLFIAGCKENPSGFPELNTDDLLPSALIISPPKILDKPDTDENDVLNIPVSNTFIKGLPVMFEGIGMTAIGDTLDSTSLSWSSDRKGELGTGSTLKKNNLDTGVHKIYLTVTDKNKQVSRDSVNIRVIDIDVVTEGPAAEITSLSDGVSLLKSVKLVLEGLGYDPEEGELSGGDLVWSSDVEGVLGTGKSLDVTGLLSLGEHIITLTATNSEGETGSATKNISIVEEIFNKSPVAKIISPDDGLNLPLLGDLILKGSGDDEEDGELAGISLEWSTEDKLLGTGTSLDITGELSLGEHTITLTVTDSEGATDSASVDISIIEVLNETPVAEILSPTKDGLTFSLLDQLILEGTALDPEDGQLPGENLVWISDVNGKLGTGQSLDVTGELSLGEHTITLTVTDSEGAKDSASVNISIMEALNETPVAEILSPNGGTLSLLDTLILEGTGTDFEDGDLDGQNFEWSVGETTYTGNSLDITGVLSLGEHTITLTVTDSEGATGSDSLKITIL